jgi:hypothetical protein
VINFLDLLSNAPSPDILPILTKYQELQVKLASFSSSSLSSSQSNWLANIFLSAITSPSTSEIKLKLKEVFGDGFLPIHKEAQKFVMVPKELLLEERLGMSEEERKLVNEAMELFEGIEKKKVI